MLELTRELWLMDSENLAFLAFHKTVWLTHLLGQSDRSKNQGYRTDWTPLPRGRRGVSPAEGGGPWTRITAHVGAMKEWHSNRKLS